jgi:hypothetical protein
MIDPVSKPLQQRACDVRRDLGKTGSLVREACDFDDDGDPCIHDPGLVVPPVTITVAEDTVELVSDNLQTAVEGAIEPVRDDLQAVQATADAAVNNTSQILSDVAQHDAEIRSEISDLRTRLVNLEAAVSEVQNALLEVVRLLHTPNGERESDLQACGGEDCTWNYDPRR